MIFCLFRSARSCCQLKQQSTKYRFTKSRVKEDLTKHLTTSVSIVFLLFKPANCVRGGLKWSWPDLSESDYQQIFKIKNGTIVFKTMKKAEKKGRICFLCSLTNLNKESQWPDSTCWMLNDTWFSRGLLRMVILVWWDSYGSNFALLSHLFRQLFWHVGSGLLSFWCPTLIKRTGGGELACSGVKKP